MEIHRSAYKHGIDADTILHALDHALTVIDLEPEADPPKVLPLRPSFHELLPQSREDLP